MKKVVLFCVIISLILGLNLALETKAEKVAPKTKKQEININGASEDSPVVFLGTALDKKTGKQVEGLAIVHYSVKSNRGKGAKTINCYGYLAKGAKWKTLENWLVDPVNSGGLGADFILGNVDKDIAKWEDAADGVIDDGGSVDILGAGYIAPGALSADNLSPDGNNEVLFGSISNPGAIAVTIVWGIFSGPVGARELVEWDQIYDDVDFAWSNSGEAGKMDFENIATHELGHSVGMNDLYNSVCSEETMYGYASAGEIKKQTLNIGDIKGVNQLY